MLLSLIPLCGTNLDTVAENWRSWRVVSTRRLGSAAEGRPWLVSERRFAGGWRWRASPPASGRVRGWSRRCLQSRALLGGGFRGGRWSSVEPLLSGLVVGTQARQSGSDTRSHARGAGSSEGSRPSPCKSFAYGGSGRGRSRTGPPLCRRTRCIRDPWHARVLRGRSSAAGGPEARGHRVDSRHRSPLRTGTVPGHRARSGASFAARVRLRLDHRAMAGDDALEISAGGEGAEGLAPVAGEAGGAEGVGHRLVPVADQERGLER